jgi:MFS family permease
VDIVAFKKIFPYVFIVFLGSLGFAMLFPILPAMFIGMKESILPIRLSMQQKSVFLGFAFASYPAGQLIGSPLLGFFSDRLGRKKIILVSLLCTAVGYMLTGIAVVYHFAYGVLGGLFLCGLSEGNVGIAQAVIGDLIKTTEKTSKALSFGGIGLCVALAFVLGPLLGGFFVDSSKGFSFSTPFQVAALLFFIAFCIIWKFAQETRLKSEKRDHGYVQFVQKIKQNYNDPLLKRLYSASFFLYCGAYTLWSYFPIYLEKQFALSSQKLSYIIAYQAFFYCVGIVFVVKKLAKKVDPRNLVIAAAVAFSFMLIIAPMPASLKGCVWTNPLSMIFLSTLITNITVMLSNAVDSSAQGQAMGILQSMNSCSGLLVSVCSGFFLAILPVLFFVIGSIMTLIGAFVIWDSRRFVRLNNS